MRLLVCGGRDFNDMDLMEKVLMPIHREHDITDLIHGNAKGADSLAALWAMQTYTKDSRFIRIWEYRADWKTHGLVAGPLRNQRMLDEGRPDLVVAFPGGRGTGDMVRRAREANINVTEVGR